MIENVFQIIKKRRMLFMFWEDMLFLVFYVFLCYVSCFFRYAQVLINFLNSVGQTVDLDIEIVLICWTKNFQLATDCVSNDRPTLNVADLRGRILLIWPKMISVDSTFLVECY